MAKFNVSCSCYSSQGQNLLPVQDSVPVPCHENEFQNVVSYLRILTVSRLKKRKGLCDRGR